MGSGGSLEDFNAWKIPVFTYIRFTYIRFARFFFIDDGRLGYGDESLHRS